MTRMPTSTEQQNSATNSIKLSKLLLQHNCGIVKTAKSQTDPSQRILKVLPIEARRGQITCPYRFLLTLFPALELSKTFSRLRSRQITGFKILKVLNAIPQLQVTIWRKLLVRPKQPTSSTTVRSWIPNNCRHNKLCNSTTPLCCSWRRMTK